MTATDRAPATACEGTAGAPTNPETNPMTLTVPGVCTAAATLIEERGWTQGDWTLGAWDDPQPCPICVLAALNLAAGHDPATTITGIALNAARALATFLGLAHLLKDADDIHDALVEVLGSGWNDDHARTKGEVVAALRATAATNRKANH